MPSPEQLEYADLLLSKAAGDLAAARALADAHNVGDDIVGFHAQQATEKALKAALAIVGVEIPLTHDVDHLVELAEGAGCDPPEAVREAGWLSPWAVQFRYVIPASLRGRAG